MAPPRSSTLIEVEFKEVAPRPDLVVASHKAVDEGDPTTLPVGAAGKNVKGTILSFDWKLTPKKTKGSFYALSEACYGTPSQRIRTGA